jgi:hypothetical protein
MTSATPQQLPFGAERFRHLSDFNNVEGLLQNEQPVRAAELR